MSPRRSSEVEKRVTTPEQDDFLSSHVLAVLATSRRDGSPQISTNNYSYDGEYIYFSVTTSRAKWVNALRQPRVAVAVNEGRKQLVVYGVAEGITDDPLRLRLFRKHSAFTRANGGTNLGDRALPVPPGDDAEYARQLDEAGRVLLRITLAKVLIND
jgi:PPOX class probable F420-dependent enzyme